jgi:cyclase
MIPAHMTRRAVVLTSLVAVGLAAVLAAPQAAQRPRPPGATFKGEAFRLTEVLPGIYHAVGSGAFAVGCNATVIVNEEDVLIVDSHSSPAAAWALTEQLRALTDKPVKYVINTHFHWDHAHGNQIYGPGVEIIGHEFTRRMLAEGASTSGRSYEMFITQGIPAQLATLEKQLAAAPAGPDRQKLEDQVAAQKGYREATASVRVQPPTVTITDGLTLHRGGREIRLLFLGRGHTGGDVVVYLPKERVVATGDLLTENPAYLGDAFVPDWIATLDRLRALEFDWVLPGHGNAFQGKAKIAQWQSYLQDFWSQAGALKRQGVAPADAAKRIDLRPHAGDYPTIKDAGILDHGVYRAYDLMDGKIR